MSKPITRVRITLTLSKLGSIPDYHEAAFPTLVAQYQDRDLAQTDLQTQIQLFGEYSVGKMIEGEVTTWLQDLGTSPHIESIALTPD